MQRYRVVILIVLLGVVPVVAAFFAALSFLKGEAAKPAPVEPVSVVAKAPPPPEPPETRKVLAAARPLPVGTLLGEEDFTELALDLGAVRTAHIIAGDAMRPDALRGYALRETLATGQAFTWPAVVGPGQRGFLAAVLRAGRRAVTVRVGPATGHAGLIDPGDRVDVILSAELQAGERERSVLTRTIVEDVRVVAVDRRLGSGTGSTGGDGVVERTEMVTATLEVSPSQGDRLVLAEHEGRLSLAVRSLAAGASRPSSAALELRDLLLSPEAVDASVREDRLREELAMMEERLRVAEEERLRLEERDRRRVEDEERRHAEDEERRRAEEERLRLEQGQRLEVAEEERLRLEQELAAMEVRIRAEREAAAKSKVRTVRVLRGSEPAEDVSFGEGLQTGRDLASGALPRASSPNLVHEGSRGVEDEHR